MRISENMSVYEAVAPQSKVAAFETNAISLKQYGNISIMITTGAFASPAGTPAVTLRQSTAVAKTGEKALGFDYVYVGSTTVDVLVKTAVTLNTFDLEENSVYIIEVNDASLDVTNSFDAVHVEVSDPGANGTEVAIHFLSSEARTTVKTVLTD